MTKKKPMCGGKEGGLNMTSTLRNTLGGWGNPDFKTYYRAQGIVFFFFHTCSSKKWSYSEKLHLIVISLLVIRKFNSQTEYCHTWENCENFCHTWILSYFLFCHTNLKVPYFFTYPAKLCHTWLYNGHTFLSHTLLKIVKKWS